jgi:hypothetical protein
MSDFQTRILDKGKYIGVTNRKGDLICCCSKLENENEVVLTSLTGSGNGDAVLFLIEHLKKTNNVDVIKIKANAVLSVTPAALDKIKRDNLLQVIP